MNDDEKRRVYFNQDGERDAKMKNLIESVVGGI
jgi:hypothetical protein